MGGLFSVPKAPPPAIEPEGPRPEEAATEARLETIRRARRGRAGTVKTSARGLLALRDLGDAKKTLLGD